MVQYVLREGAITAADTSTAATAQGSQTAPGGIQVPTGVSQIVYVMIAFEDNPGTTAGGRVFFVRIGGNGVVQGEQDIVAGASENVDSTPGAVAATSNAIIIPTAILVTPTNTLTINVEGGGTGTPTSNVCVGLAFA